MDTNVGIVDIMPTVLDVLGLPLPAHLNGRSLVPLITDDSGADAVYFAELAGKVRSVRRGRWKLIATDGENGETIELFDTETDPDEQRNLFGSEPTRARTLRSLHREWLELAGAQGQRLDAVEFEYDEALESALRSLGYVD